MVYLWDPDYIGNSDNRFYVRSSGLLNMDWKEFRNMYEHLHPEPKKELDIFMGKVEHMKTWEDIRRIKEHENRPFSEPYWTCSRAVA